MSNIVFTNLESYYSSAYVNSYSSSSAYKSSISDLNSINIETGSVNASMSALVRLANATYTQNYYTGYNTYKDAAGITLAQYKQNVATLLAALVNATITDSFLAVSMR